jgi:cofilin
MPATSGIAPTQECMEAFNQLKLGRTGVKYIIFKIVNDKEIVVADQSKEKDFDIFQKEMTKSDDGGAVDPKYAVYDCEYELPGGDGKRFALNHFDLYAYS